MRIYKSLYLQRGYFLILAMIFIMVIGVMGAIISHMYTTQARMSVAQHDGLRVFYLAESGLEITSRLLTGSNLVPGQALTCNTLTGSALVTNASVLTGTFTATAVGGGLYSASSTLSGAITATSNSMTLASATGFAPQGRVRVGSEAIDYASLSGNTLNGLNRGVAGTSPAAHTTGASVSESVCLVNVQAGIPSIAAPRYQRGLNMVVEILPNGTDIWAIGNRFGNQFSLIRYGTPTSNSWNDYTYSDVHNREDLKAVSPISMNDAWAVGNEKTNSFTFLRWNGTSWSRVAVAGACSSQNLNGVSAISTSEAWAVGSRYRPACSNNGNYRYTLTKWNGTSWVLLTPSSSPSIPADGANHQTLNAISMIDSNEDGIADFGFAVGDAGTILQYTGAAWVTSASGSAHNLLGVSVLSAQEAWAVSDQGAILKWNGSAWGSVSAPSGGDALRAINMLDTNGDGLAETGWAVGDSGTMLSYNNGTWSQNTSPTNRDLYGVVTVNASSAWAVGAFGTIVQWDGASLTTVSSPTGAKLNGMGLKRGAGSGAGSPVGSWPQGTG